MVPAIAPSSAAAEPVFSLMSAVFSTQQERVLEDQFALRWHKFSSSTDEKAAAALPSSEVTKFSCDGSRSTLSNF